MSKRVKIIIGVVVVLGVFSFIAGFAILAMSGLFIVTSASSQSPYFVTVNEVVSQDNLVDKQIRISGAVIGDSIEYDDTSRKLSFLVANVPSDYEQVEQQGGLAVVLERAVNNPNLQRIQVVYIGEKPDLLRNMAQAIMAGELHADGIFYADEILLKCPARYEEAVPNQAVENP
jgi:cytochrome c-type biogenesis protein CcmE